MNLPWTTLEKGQGFFIPALDLDPVREAGLLAAVRMRVLDAQSLYCIHDKMIGVLFFRKPAAPARVPRHPNTSEQSAPSAHPEP